MNNDNRILKINESRANCKGNSKLSVHAEECAIKDSPFSKS